MGRRVPLTRRFLFGDRGRAALSTAGVAVALLLVLILDGIFAGATRQVTAYLRASPADVIVSQAGVRTMHMSTSALPSDVVGQARAVPGVAWADPIWFATGTIATATGRQLSYVIGYTPGRPGGPRHLVTGRPPANGDAVIDRVAASQLRLHLGDPVRVLGRTFRLVGLSSGGTSIVNTTTFVTAADLAALTMRVSSRCAVSRASAERISTPASAPLPVDTMIDSGVANPSAHGHAMISTATADTSAKVNAGAGPTSNQATKLAMATNSTPGTKNRDTESARRWIGAFELCAA